MGRVWCVCVGCDTHRLSCGVSDVIHFVLTVDVIVDIYISRLVARRSVVVLGVENNNKAVRVRKWRLGKPGKPRRRREGEPRTVGRALLPLYAKRNCYNSPSVGRFTEHITSPSARTAIRSKISFRSFRLR